MTKALRWQIALALVFVFLAGVAIGAFTSVYHVRRLMFEHRPEHLRGRLSDHLRRELSLTPEQFDKIRPIVDRSADRLEEIRAETGHRVAETMRQSHAEIAPLLTGEQKAKLEQMHERHMRGLHRHGLPPPP